MAVTAAWPPPRGRREVGGQTAPPPVSASSVCNRVTYNAISRVAIVLSRTVIVFERTAIGIEMTVIVLERTAIVLEKTAIGIEKTAIGIERTAIGIERTAIGIEKTAIVLEKTAIVLEKTAIVLERTAVVLERTAIVLERTAIGIERTAIGIERTAIVLERTAMGIERTAIGIERTAIGIERTAIGIEKTAIVLERTAMGIEMQHVRPGKPCVSSATKIEGETRRRPSLGRRRPGARRYAPRRRLSHKGATRVPAPRRAGRTGADRAVADGACRRGVAVIGRTTARGSGGGVHPDMGRGRPLRDRVVDVRRAVGHLRPRGLGGELRDQDALRGVLDPRGVRGEDVHDRGRIGREHGVAPGRRGHVEGLGAGGQVVEHVSLASSPGPARAGRPDGQMERLPPPARQASGLTRPYRPRSIRPPPPMPIPDALLRRVTLHATASDAADALRVLHVAEAVVHRAVEAAALAIGDEVLVLDRVELDFAVDLDGRQPLAPSQMERALRSALTRVIQRARAGPSSEPVVTERAAWFPSEAAAIGELLAAHAEGRASAWPYASLTLWGATPGEILRTCLARGRVLLGDVLAAAIRRLDGGVLLGLVSEELAATLVAACTEGASDRTLAASALPADLRAAVAAEIARLSYASPTQRDLVTLARLFALWPPARDARIPLVELRLLAAPSPGSAEAPPAQVLAELLGGTVAAELHDRLPADVVAALVAWLRGPREGRDASLASLRALLERDGDDGLGSPWARMEAGREAALASLWARLEKEGIGTEELRRAVEGAEGRRLAELVQGTVAAELYDRLPADVAVMLVALLRGPREGRDAALTSLWARLEKEGIATGELRRAVEGAQVKRLVSAAGGLVAWAALFAAEGLSAEIDEAYPEPRAQRAVRWAVGCALEDARIGGVDPTLLLWAGEDVDALLDPGLALAAADPEALHRRALRFAMGRGLLSTPLDAARFGDFVTLTGDAGFCVDAVLGDDANRAIPELVRRFASRVGASPAGVRVTSRMSGEAVDALVEVDVPPLADPWRVAVRAFASAARSALLGRWRAPVRDLRRWPAIVEIGRDVAVELLRTDVSRVGAGGWLRESVQMSARNIVVRVK